MSEQEGLKPGSMPSLVAGILYRRRYRPYPVWAIAELAHAEPAQVSSALQRLQELGMARNTGDGWVYVRNRK